MPVEKWPAAWEALGKGIEQANAAQQAVDARIAALEAEIMALDNAASGANPAGRPERQIAISVEVATPIDGEMEVTYQASGASWQPVYDASSSRKMSRSRASI